ncbi:uncharacterized protein LOC111395163 [Olea europaea subsp. europaea]|uniref:Uncharacterized protein LOC111395163, partial n=1 Tax=Olea europaea subsp. europaea TaxID=158383 RepID=A0A8S0UK67_OLEEU|nr:uncharacterized protein LOC111395163 [Olea europaea subsp. europaea]
MAAVNFKYWNDCVDPQDLEAMWRDPGVKEEWLNVGETMGSKVHLSRDPDGQPYLTQTEMKKPLATQYNKKSKDCMMGIMQISPKTAEWLVRDLSYPTYEVDGNSKLLYKAFVNVYLGAAHLKWLSNFEQIERSEEFMVRAYKGGTKKATHKSTLKYWHNYLSVKETLPTRTVFKVAPLPNALSASSTAVSTRKRTNPAKITWDSRTSPEDMEEMWNNANVSKEWNKSGEKRGKVRLSHDTEKRPYLS